MSIELIESQNGKVLEVSASGRLTDEDYQGFIPEVDRLVRQHGKIRLLFKMVEFHGWDAKAAWDDFKLGVKHYNDIERVAVAGEKKWQQRMTAFAKPFTAAAVRYFDQTEIGQARAWAGEAC